MSGSQSDHQRAWANLEARRKIRDIAAQHFGYILCNGGTLDEVDAAASAFKSDIALASVPLHARDSQRYQAEASPNMIHTYIQRDGKMEKP